MDNEVEDAMDMHPNTAIQDCGNKSLSRTRSRSTLSRQMLKDKRQRREIGQRVKELRERSGLTQEQLAKRIHVGLRQYQNYEHPGLGDYSTAERLAKLHWRLWAKDDPEWGFVSPGWLWDGKDRRETPDVLQRLTGFDQAQLDRIEAALKRIEETQAVFLTFAEAAAAEQEVPDASPSPAPSERQSVPMTSARGRQARSR